MYSSLRFTLFSSCMSLVEIAQHINSIMSSVSWYRFAEMFTKTLIEMVNIIDRWTCWNPVHLTYCRTGEPSVAYTVRIYRPMYAISMCTVSWVNVSRLGLVLLLNIIATWKWVKIKGLRWYSFNKHSSSDNTSLKVCFGKLDFVNILTMTSLSILLSWFGHTIS